MLRTQSGAWMLALALFLGASMAHAADDEMGRVKLLMQKLRESMQSLRDLDELEKAGMPKQDVDRMRRALQSKIQQMIDETVRSIRAL